MEQASQTLIAALLLGSASGCATIDYDAPHMRPPLTNARPAARPVTIVQILPGDNLQRVADRFDVSEQTIIDANGLREPYHLHPGQSLILPPSSIHIVASGDTVASIARSYGVSPGAIVEVNNLYAPDALFPGERLAIPFVGQHQIARAERVPASVTTSDLGAPDASGDDPRLAGGRYYTAGLPRPKPRFDGEGGPELSGPPRPPHEQVASIDNDDAYDAPSHVKSAPPGTPIKSSSHFVWPVRGQIISGFGRRENGVHNDGINIAAEPGASVKAADNGVVVYAGNELAGYGNLLLIRHSNGFVTAYAHNKKLLVGKGDNVRQGQTIALVGSTGDVDRPQLHFEIRRGDRAVDPSRFLESANASL